MTAGGTTRRVHAPGLPLYHGREVAIVAGEPGQHPYAIVRFVADDALWSVAPRQQAFGWSALTAERPSM